MEFRNISQDDEDALFEYFQNLSDATRKRFGPHPFDRETAHQICTNNLESFLAYICLDGEKIVAYTVVKPGYLGIDLPRYKRYSLTLDFENDYTLAPSVSDAYQSKGVGSKLYGFVENDLKEKGAKKIILWFGVQSTNEKALGFYRKHGFKALGEFEHDGKNLDMYKMLSY